MRPIQRILLTAVLGVSLFGVGNLARCSEDPAISQTRNQASFAQETEKEVTISGPSDSTPASIPVRREKVVVTGSFEPVPLEEVERSVEQFDTREAPELYNTWVDYLHLDPSLDLRQRAPNGVQADLSIRGATFGQTLVLVNGIRVNDAQSGHHNLDVPFPMTSMERIEVLRGAGSTLYGSDAVGGAVNFIVAPPALSEIRLGTAVGNFGTNQQQGSLTYSTQRWGEQLSFSRDFSTGFMPDRDYRNLGLGSMTRLTSGLGNTSVLLSYGDRPFGANQFYGNYNSWERTKTWFAALSQDLGSKTQVSLSYRRHTDIFVLFRDRPQVYKNDHQTEGWNAALRRRETVGQNGTFSYGVEGYRDSIQSTNLGLHARNRGAVYMGFDLRALRRFSFTVGAREDLYSSGLPGASGVHGQFNPSIGGGVWLKAGLKLRAAVSRAFRLPTYTDLYYRDPATTGNPDLRPESAWSYEGGLDWSPGGRLASAITVFHWREHDGIDYIRFTPTDLWRATNIQNLNFTGAEIVLKVRLSDVQRLTFSYTGLHGVQEDLGNITSRYVLNYASNSGVAAWEGELPGKIRGRTRLGVSQRRLRDAYPLWDCSASRTFGRWTPYLQVTNLSGTGYQEIAGVPMPGRAFVVGVQFASSIKK